MVKSAKVFVLERKCVKLLEEVKRLKELVAKKDEEIEWLEEKLNKLQKER